MSRGPGAGGRDTGAAPGTFTDAAMRTRHGVSPAGEAAADLGARPGLAVLVGLVLLLAVSAVFAPVLDFGWTGFDDDHYVTAQPRVQSWSADNVAWMFTQTSTFYWHPGTLLWHAAQWSLSGDDPRGHHLAGLVLHALGSLAVFLLLLALVPRGEPPLLDRDRRAAAGARLLAAGAAALLWAVHPLRAEPVGWIAGQKELLSTIFMAAAAMAWLGRGGGRDRAAWWASLLLLAAALTFKPMAMVLPAVFLVLDAVPLGRWTRRSDLPGLLREKVPHLLICAAAVLPSVLDPRQDELLMDRSSLGTRAVTALWGTAFPLVKTVFPSGLLPYYPLERAASVGMHGRYLAGALVLVAVTVVAVRLFLKGHRAPAAAWAAYLLLVFPVSGIRQAGGVETADRFAHVPSLALFALVAAGLAPLLARRGAPTVLAVLATATMFGLTARRPLAAWRDAGTLWTPVAAARPDLSPTVHQNLGAWYLRRALLEKDEALRARAEGELRRALEIDAGSAGARNNMGLLLSSAGRLPEAEDSFRAAIGRDPGFTLAHANLAVVLAQMGRVEEARAAWRDAVDTGGWIPPPILRMLVHQVQAPMEKR